MYEFDRYTSIEEFGYEFNEDGELRSKETGKPFNFVVKCDDPVYNQKHYEALGEVVTEEVYKLLTTRKSGRNDLGYVLSIIKKKTFKG